MEGYRVKAGVGCSELFKDLAEKVVQKVQVGVHWDTEVWTGTHRVCQVFCSALPVAYFKSAATSSDWQGQSTLYPVALRQPIDSV